MRLDKAALCAALFLCLIGQFSTHARKQVHAPMKEHRKHLENPCPHLNTTERPLRLVNDENGNEILCCGCGINQYYEAPCRKSKYQTTVCLECPSDHILNDTVHIKGIGDCKPIALFQPTPSTRQESATTDVKVVILGSIIVLLVVMILSYVVWRFISARNRFIPVSVADSNS